MTLDPDREFEIRYQDRLRGIRQAARLAVEELALFHLAASTAAEVDAEVARIARERLHHHGCDLVVCRTRKGQTRFLIKVRSTGKEYDLIKSFFHSDNGIDLQTEA